MAAGARQCKDGKRQARAGHASFLLPLAALVVGVPFAAQAAEQENPGTAQEKSIPAVLKQQEVDFFYRSSVAPLSCTDLQSRVGNIFRALGARDDVAVTIDRCDTVVTPSRHTAHPWPNSSSTWSGSSSNRWQTPPSGAWPTTSDPFAETEGREQSSHVRVRLMLPVEVTPEVLDQMQKDKSRRELVSRVTGNPAAGMNDPIVFPAQRQRVTLSHKTVDLEPQDCELLEQMSTTVFRELGMRIVNGYPRCDRREVSHIPPQLTVETLMPVVPKGPSMNIAPGGGGSGQEAPATSPATSEGQSSGPATATPSH